MEHVNSFPETRVKIALTFKRKQVWSFLAHKCIWKLHELQSVTVHVLCSKSYAFSVFLLKSSAVCVANVFCFHTKKNSNPPIIYMCRVLLCLTSPTWAVPVVISYRRYVTNHCSYICRFCCRNRSAYVVNCAETLCF
jgi:hypothetical protein